MTAGHFVADGNLSLLSDINADKAIDTRRELVVVLAAEHFDVDDFSRLTMRHAERGVANLARFLTKNRPKQSFFRRKLRLALRRDLAYENIAGTDLRTNADNPLFVKIAKSVLRNVRNIPSDFFRPQLRIAGVTLIFFNMNGSIEVALHEILAQKHRVLIVIAFPRHISNNDIVSQRQLAMIRCRPVGNRLVLDYIIAFIYDRHLINAGSLVGA